jgi:hypothetical protein
LSLKVNPEQDQQHEKADSQERKPTLLSNESRPSYKNNEQRREAQSPHCAEALGVAFLWYCRSTAQGIQIKPGKNPRIIWDGLTKDLPEQIVINEITPTEFEAVINFGKVKIKILTIIYNWQISFLLSIIYIALSDKTVCLWFSGISADIT